MNLEALSDDDLTGLTAWAEPIAKMDSRVFARWGQLAWQAAIDEQRRRIDGGNVTPWPSSTQLRTEEIKLLGHLLVGIRGAGSPELAEFVEQAGEELTDTLVDRTERWARGASGA